MLLDDTNVIAFLFYKKHKMAPVNDPDGTDRVFFLIDGDPREISDSLKEYYGNTKVGVQEFCSALKSVKSAMYTFKKTGKPNGR